MSVHKASSGVTTEGIWSSVNVCIFLHVYLHACMDICCVCLLCIVCVLIKGGHILVRGLLRLSNPGSVFSTSLHLLHWAFTQPSLQTIARTWVSQHLDQNYNSCIHN